MDKVVVYMGTRNVYADMLPAVKSLLYNTPSIDKIYFIIEDDEYPFPIPSKIECINLNNFPVYFNLKTCPNISKHCGKIVLYRAIFPSIFFNLDQILSLDNDTIIQDDISELWDYNLTDYYIAGVKDAPSLQKDKVYVNAGVLMYNLKKMRQDQTEEKLIKILNTQKFQYAEQCAFNYFFYPYILTLSETYNYILQNHRSDYNPNNKKILHFAGISKYKNNNNFINYYKKLEMEGFI